MAYQDNAGAAMQGLASGLQTGMQMGQQRKARAQQQQQFEQQLDLDKQRLGMQKQLQSRQIQKYDLELGAIRQDQNLMQGLTQAHKEGGYSGAVDFLNQNDPQRAQQYQQAQADLEKTILSNTNASQLNKKEKGAFMHDQYQMLGNFTRMFDATNDPKEQQRMWNLISPIVKTLVPDAPDTYNSRAESILRLSEAQAIPAHLAMEAKKDMGKMETQIGKLMSDKAKLTNQGVGRDSEQFKTIQAQIDKHNYEADIAKNKVMRLSLGGKSPSEAEDALRKEFTSESKAIKERQDIYQRVNDRVSQKAFVDWTGADDIMLVYSQIHMLEPGMAVKEGEMIMSGQAAGLPETVVGMYNFVVGGGNLSIEARQQISDSVSDIMESSSVSFERSKGFYTKLSTDRGLDVSHIITPILPDGTAKTSPKEQKQLSRSPKQMIQKITALDPGFNAQKVLADYKKMNPKATDEEILFDYLKYVKGNQ